MPTTADSSIQLTDEEKVVGWRMDVLTQAGYTEGTAVRLAENKDVDLHRAVGLIENGCPEALAIQILI